MAWHRWVRAPGFLWELGGGRAGYSPPSPGAASSSRFWDPSFRMCPCWAVGLRQEPPDTPRTPNTCRTTSALQTESLSPSLPPGSSCQDHECPAEVAGACCASARGEDKPHVPSSRPPPLPPCPQGMTVLPVELRAEPPQHMSLEETHPRWGPAPGLPWRDSSSCLITTLPCQRWGLGCCCYLCFFVPESVISR